MKYVFDADWKRLVQNAERYEVLYTMYRAEKLAAGQDPLTREAFDLQVDLELDRQADTCLRRASGDCLCQTCGKEYREHPLGGPMGYDGFQFLHRLCDGSLVKL